MDVEGRGADMYMARGLTALLLRQTVVAVQNWADTSVSRHP